MSKKILCDTNSQDILAIPHSYSLNVHHKFTLICMPTDSFGTGKVYLTSFYSGWKQYMICIILYERC